MIKKLLKIVLKGIAGIILLTVILYGGFHLWEYSTGGKYIDYLNNNSETINLDESFSFNQLDKDIEDNSLVLVGEIHGFEEPQKFDYDLFTHLHSNHNVRYYYAELDYIQATYLNKYMETGDETLLKSALSKWAVAQGRDNMDYFDKYRKFHNYYSQLASDNKFMFIGIDRIQDLNLTYRFLNSLNPSSTDSLEYSGKIDVLIEKLKVLDTIYKNAPDTLFMLSHIKTNLESIAAKENRENIMFANFHNLYQKLRAKEEKAYGFFGLYHVFQYQVNGQQPLASQIRTSDLGLETEILSINFLMVDSYMVMPSNELPDFMRDQGTYTRMPISADVMLFMYIYGIKDLKRITPEYHKSIIKMNSDSSPYATSNRMTRTIQFLPVADKFEFNDKGKPYVQYTVFVRNSDWAEPMKE
jgi:hypothetical protein